jgi:hypothetical protein
MNQKKSKYIPLLISIIVIITSYCLVFPPKKSVSANLSNVKNTLSSSQFSYFARLGVGNSLSSSILTIQTANNPSNTTSNLFTDDLISIGNTNATTLTNYTVRDIGNTATFQITTGLEAQNIYNGLAIIATRSAIHTVEFTPSSILPGGSFRVLIKASNSGGTKAFDGIPDQDGFDLGADVGATTIGLGTALKTADITCPTIPGATLTPSIATFDYGGDTYHSIACSLGAGETNALTSYTITIGRDLGTGSQLINPAPSSGRPFSEEGDADVYTFYVQHQDNSATIIDSSQGRIAVVESVRVTATVDPTLTFTIDTTNTTSGQTRCGITLGSNANNTTPTAVKFGSLSISSFNDLAQRLSCVTNASGGYAVTAFESKPLTNISTGTTIVDTTCDSGPCTISSAIGWTTPTNYGFGYSVENINADTVDFSYGGGSNYVAKPFGIGSANAATLFSNSNTPSATERIYVCYRVSVSTLQEAGEYENGITYTATTTF